MKINVLLDKKLYSDFVYFENFCRKKIWVLPLFFMIISFTIAFVCFLISSSKNLDYLLTFLFITIGITLPIVYFYSYWSSLKKQLKIFDLKKNISAYSLYFSKNSVEIFESNNKKTYNLDSIYNVFMYKDSIYLFVESNKAYILPIKQMDNKLNSFLTKLVKA